MSVCLSLVAGPSARYDRKHPVWQLRPKDQLHHRCLWDENRWAAEGKTERWPRSTLIHPDLIKKPWSLSKHSKTAGTHQGLVHYLSKKKKKNGIWPMCNFKWFIDHLLLKNRTRVNVGHMFRCAKTLPWTFLREACDCVKVQKVFKRASASINYWGLLQSCGTSRADRTVQSNADCLSLPLLGSSADKPRITSPTNHTQPAIWWLKVFRQKNDIRLFLCSGIA